MSVLSPDQRDLARIAGLPAEQFDSAWSLLKLEIGRRMASPDPSERWPAAMQRIQAAEYLGLSVDLFDAEIRPRLSFIPVNSVRLYPKTELDRWVKESAQPAPVPTRNRRG